MTTHYLVTNTSTTGWEQTIYAFLAEKERRSGSIRTVESYSRMLYHRSLPGFHNRQHFLGEELQSAFCHIVRRTTEAEGDVQLEIAQ